MTEREATELEERAAKATFVSLYGDWHSTQWEFMQGPENVSEEQKDRFRKIARASIRALHGRGTVWPAGVVDAMVMAFDKNYGRHGLSETLMACFNAAIDEISPLPGHVTARQKRADARQRAMIDAGHGT